MKRYVILIVFSLTIFAIQAQTARHGRVEDAVCNPVSGASVTLVRNGKPLKFVKTNSQGAFGLSVRELQAADSLQVSCMGYAKTTVKIEAKGATNVQLAAKPFELNEVTVRGGRILGRQDTTVYDLTRFASERDNSLKDVLKKLPGVEVASDGMLTVNGKTLSRFTVEGLDLTGGRYNQLEENIKAKDVKNAEIIHHDQPIKALEGKVLTDNVAMNIVLKDEARDKLLPTIKPQLLIGEPVSVGGSANMLQIGKSRQWMYDLAYDRTGKDLSQQTNPLAVYGGGLPAAGLPSWHAVPSIYAPIAAERIRFNTSQRYGASRIQKLKNDGELRFTANYLRTVERQATSNETVYDFGGATPVVTTQNQHLTLLNDHFSTEIEHKINTASTYGKDLLSISARQSDGLSALNDTLAQRIRTPELNISGSLYRLYTLGKGQLSVQSVMDFHHSVSDLYINDLRTRLRTNLWHSAVSVGWLRKRLYLTRQYSGGFDLRNLNLSGSNVKLSAHLSPYFQYERGKFQASLTPRLVWERLVRQQRSFLLLQPSVYLKWKSGRRSEWTLAGNYGEGTGQMGEFILNSYRRNYRTYSTNDGLIRRTRNLFSTLEYIYKRPVREIFFNAGATVGRSWQNVLTDLRIADGNYYLSLKECDTKTDYRQVEASVSKGFSDLHLKARLNGSFTYNKGQQLSDGNLLQYTSRVYNLMPNIEFAPTWGALSYEGRFRWDRSSVMETLFGWEQNLSLTSTFGPIDLTCSMTHHRNELQQGNTLSVLLADLKAVWRMNHFRLSLNLTNLFNKKEYIVRQNTGISTSTDYYTLRGRELLLALQYSF